MLSVGASWASVKTGPSLGGREAKRPVQTLDPESPQILLLQGGRGHSPRPCCLGTGHGVQGQDLFLAGELGAAPQQWAWGFRFCWAGRARPRMATCCPACAAPTPALSLPPSPSAGGEGGQAGLATTCAKYGCSGGSGCGLCRQGSATPCSTSHGAPRTSVHVVTCALSSSLAAAVSKPTWDPGREKEKKNRVFSSGQETGIPQGDPSTASGEGPRREAGVRWEFKGTSVQRASATRGAVG